MMIVDECELTEYTGLKDRHGREIFEGDICKVEGGWSGDCIQEMHVLTAFHFWGEVVNNIDNDADYKVVGNIYENPELLIMNRNI